VILDPEPDPPGHPERAASHQLTTCSERLCDALIIGVVLDHFLASALSFEGWAAHLYAVVFAAALTLFLWAIWSSPFLLVQDAPALGSKSVLRSNPFAGGSCSFSIGCCHADLVGGGDWNGVQQSLPSPYSFWIVLSLCVYTLRPRRKRYSAAAILAVLLLAGFTYKALQATDIFWARALGSTDDDVARAMETYAGQDTSFQVGPPHPRQLARDALRRPVPHTEAVQPTFGTPRPRRT